MTPEQRTAAEVLSDTMSWRKISKHLGVPKSTVSDYLRKVQKKNAEGDFPKILFIDVEVQGSLNISFPRFKAFISPSAVLKEPYLLTFASNWAHEPEEKVLVKGLDDYSAFEDNCQNDILLVEELWELLDQADVVIAHNNSFDRGQINSRFAYYGIDPPSDYKTICTLKALKQYFKLPANSLDAATKYFELERKLSHEGISLWVDCFKGDVEAFKKLKEYNHGDIPTLRQLYYKVLPFIKNHPNLAVYYGDDKVRCNNCGGVDMKLTSDYAYTNLSKFHTYRCGGCGATKRTRKNLRGKGEMDSTLMNIV